MALRRTYSQRTISFCIALVTVCLGILGYTSGVYLLDVMELKTIDFRFQSRGPLPPRPDVVLAVIDEKSIAREGKWIWPRSKIAELVTRLSKAGARVIAFDIGFLEADDRRVIHALGQVTEAAGRLRIESREFEAFLRRLQSESDHDLRLAAAIADSQAKIVLGYFFQMEETAGSDADAGQDGGDRENISASRYSRVRSIVGSDEAPPMITAAAALSNIDEISRAGRLAGYFNMLPDPDGVVRWLPAVVRYGEDYYAPLALMAVSAYLDRPLSLRLGPFGVEALHLGESRIPTDELGRILINYRGGPKSFVHIPVTDILSGDASGDLIRGRIVIVGATALGIFDDQVSPFPGLFPGVEIHANAIDTLLSRDFLRQPAWSVAFDLLAMVFLGLILGLVLPGVGGVAGALVGLVTLSGYILFCQYLFEHHGWILNLVYPLAVASLIYALVTAYKYLMESRQRRFIRDAFSTYLAPAVVKELVDSREMLELGGEERDITAFFSDVQGFTSISERQTPQELVVLLNEFLTEMTDIILAHKGTVDKFEGDAIIAFFGAPADQPDHAAVACLAAIRMQQRLEVLRGQWRAGGRPELKMRIGLCSGPAVVGNMGSKNRMDYTMMGDTVNTAARLEGINKIYGTYSLAGETTCRAAGQGIVAREIDTINVKGKSEPVTVYELLGEAGDLDERLLEMTEIYRQGLRAYRSRKWDQAIGHFSAALTLRPEDGASRTLRDRCRTYQADPPPPDWNGSFVMATK